MNGSVGESRQHRRRTGSHWLINLIAGCLVVAVGHGPSFGQVKNASAENPPDERQSQRLLQLLDEHARQMLQHRPAVATWLGIGQDYLGQDLSGRLGDYRPESIKQWQDRVSRLRDELDRFDRANLNRTAGIAYDVVAAQCDTATGLRSTTPSGGAEGEIPSVYWVTQLSGPQLFLPQVMQVQQRITSAEDAEHYLARLAQVDRVMDETVALVQLDAQGGVIPPRFALRKAAAVVRAFVAPPAVESPLVITFQRKLEEVRSIAASDRAGLVARAVRTVQSEIYPAYGRLAEALDGLLDKSPEGAGIWRVPQGEQIYAILLEQNGAAGKTPQQVHEIGLSEVERISREMDRIMRQQGLNEGTVGRRLREMYNNPRFLYDNSDAGRQKLLDDLNGQLAEIATLLPKYFGTVPPQRVEIRRIPIYEQDAAPGGYYTSPALDGSLPGIYWINLRDTAEWPSWSLKTLTYHEANPGHHFQMAIKFANKDIPMIQNLAMFGAFAEGWALYAEKLAAEMGLYRDDPFGDLGRLQAELFRAVRLVVDTGIHHKRWTRDQAIQYMMATAGSLQSEATTEIERYAVWPAQACSYKLGMLKFEQLRARAETTVQDRFDLRAFHDMLLRDGDVPLTVLEAKTQRWIDELKQFATPGP